MKSQIAKLHARSIWDSRGRPTIEVEVQLAGGASGRAAAPAGASRGIHEATDLRDGGERFGGMGVDRAVAAANDTIAPLLMGRDARDQTAIDRLMIEADGTRTLADVTGRQDGKLQVQLRRDGTTRQVDQQSMVDHIPTVRVDKRQQEVVPTADPGVHHVGVPLLIRPRLLEGVDTGRPRRALPPVQQVRLA